MKESGFGEGEAARNGERCHGQSAGVHDRKTPLYEDRMAWAPGVQRGYGKVQKGGIDAGDLEPLDGGEGLIVTARMMVLWNVVEGISGDGVGVDSWIEGEICEGTLGGNDKAAMETLEVWATNEQIQDLRRVEVHQRVVHKHSRLGGQRCGGFGIANAVGSGETKVDELYEARIESRKFAKL